jgi:hypothetical protein
MQTVFTKILGQMHEWMDYFLDFLIDFAMSNCQCNDHIP